MSVGAKDRISIKLQQSIKYYDVEYNGTQYLVISTYDVNTDYNDVEVLCDGEVVEDTISDSILEAFSTYDG